MPEEPPTSERAAVYYIAAIIKNYEPEFELRKNFTPGLFGRSDPRYPTVRREWLHGLVRNGHLEKRLLSLAEASDDLVDHHSDEADSRLNWRITFQHAFYLIHIMALDKTFQRFALSVQTKSDFKEGLISIRKRPPYLRHEVVSRLRNSSRSLPIFGRASGVKKKKVISRAGSMWQSHGSARIGSNGWPTREKGGSRLVIWSRSLRSWS